MVQVHHFSRDLQNLMSWQLLAIILFSLQWLVSTCRVINFPRSYFNTSQPCHSFPDASEMLVCYAKPLLFSYLESTLQNPRHKTRKAPPRPNFSYLSGNFSSCVTCNVMVNITIIQQKPQNFQGRQKRHDRLLCGVMV